MTPEQLTEAVRKHAKTILLPSVAQAIVEELTREERAHVLGGSRLVPVEPTPEMLKAMEINWMWGSSADVSKREYESALKFAPQPKEST